MQSVGDESGDGWVLGPQELASSAATLKQCCEIFMTQNGGWSRSLSLKRRNSMTNTQQTVSGRHP